MFTVSFICQAVSMGGNNTLYYCYYYYYFCLYCCYDIIIILICTYIYYSYVIFSILPTIADILIAIVYFISAFNIYFGLIVFGTMVLYLGRYCILSSRK